MFVFFLPKIFSFWPGQKVQQQTTRRFGSGTRRSVKTTSFVVVVVVVGVGEDDLVQVFFVHDYVGNCATLVYMGISHQIVMEPHSVGDPLI